MSTKFSFEVPLKHIDDFLDLQDYGFFLSMHMTDSRVLDYYAHCQELRLPTIIDNSFNELQKGCSFAEMQKLFWAFNPTMVVAPDDDSWDDDLVLQQAKSLCTHVPKDRILGIFKNKMQFNRLQDLGVWLACSYEQRPILHNDYTRAAQHFLGLISPWEIAHFKPLTCDTAMPIKIALEGKNLQEWIFEGCPHIHTRGDSYFLTEMTDKQLTLARTNILALKEACKW